jgi:hypothetical protein
MTVYFKEITDLLCALFPPGVDGLLAIWREGDSTAVSPLDEQFKGKPLGSRLICIPIAMPTEGGTLPGMEEAMEALPAAQYTIDLYCLEKHGGNRTTYPLSQRQGLLNWAKAKVETWCAAVRAHTATKPPRFTIHDARIISEEVDATSPLTSHGWLTAGLRLTVLITEP